MIGDILHIHKDDIESLSLALEDALRRKVHLSDNSIIIQEDNEPDIDPFFGVFPNQPKRDVDYPYIGMLNLKQKDERYKNHKGMGNAK